MGNERSLDVGATVGVDNRHEEAVRVSAGSSADAGEMLSRRVLAAVFPLIAILGVGCWWLLYRWYGVFEHIDTPHFAFEKLPGGFDSPVLRDTLLVFLTISTVYIALLWYMVRAGRMTPWRIGALSVLAVGMLTGAVFLYPVGALDVFNYMIELKLTFHYDENPYLVTFSAYRDDPYALPAFLVDVTLFYGPAWLLASWIPVAVTGFTDVLQTLLGLKIFNAALVVGIALIIARFQKDNQMRWLTAAIFLVNPLVLFEGVANVHNDVLLTAFLVGAMFALERRSPLAGPLLALSALVKIYTAVLIPLFVVVALKGRWGWKRIASTVALTAVTVVIACAPFWDGGDLVDGFQVGLEESQGMDHVSPYSLTLQYAQLQHARAEDDVEFMMSRPVHEILPESTRDNIWNGYAAILIVSTIALAASAWKGRAPAIVAAETLLLLFLTTTNLYAWYLIPVIGLIALRPDKLSLRYIVIATTMGLAYYPMYVYAHFNTEWTRFEVHQFLALFLTLPILLFFAFRLVEWTLAAVRRRRMRLADAA